jgi:hypothetical protein
VYRAEWSAAGEVADWQERRYESIGIVRESSTRAVLPTSPVLICIFRGEFKTPTGPVGPDGLPNPQHTLLRVLIFGDSEFVVDSAGYDGELKPETPADWQEAQAAG